MNIMFGNILCWALVILSATFMCTSTDVFDYGDYCRERNRLIGVERNDLYKLIDGIPGAKVMMECHYCNESDDHAPKVWYRRDVMLREPPREVDLEMASNVSLDRVFVNTLHRLTIRNISKGDEGVYYCHGILGQETQFKFNYLLDLTVPSSSGIPVTGNLSEWRDYQSKYLMPMNQRLRLSEEPDFVRLREKDRVEVEAVSEWEPWGPCEACRGSSGTRSRLANCRLKPTRYSNATDVDISSSALDSNDTLFLGVVELSCQSEILSQTFPVLSEYTRDLPVFIRTEPCVGSCAKAPQATRPDTQVRYKKRYILAERAHLTLVCPEASSNTHITWRKDGVLIDAAATYRAFTEDAVEPKIVVDTFRTLYLHEVTNDEAGNYTCYINGARVQEAIIYVVAKSMLLKQAFLRHMTYIGFIFLLSFVFYCAGVSILCTRREKFENFDHVHTENRTLM